MPGSIIDATNLADSANHEVWIVHVPTSLNSDRLHDLNVDFSGENVVVDSKRKFVGKAKKKKNKIHVASVSKHGKSALASVSVKGEITFTEDVEFNFDEVEPVTLPTERAIDRPVHIKRRHPLFGTPEATSTNMEEDPDKSMTKKSKKRKSGAHTDERSPKKSKKSRKN